MHICASALSCMVKNVIICILSTKSAFYELIFSIKLEYNNKKFIFCLNFIH